MTQELIDEINKMQAAYHRAYASFVEVETRDSGWRGDDYDRANSARWKAKAAYYLRFGMNPEEGERDDLGFYCPPHQASPERVRMLLELEEAAHKFTGVDLAEPERRGVDLSNANLCGADLSEGGNQ